MPLDATAQCCSPKRLGREVSRRPTPLRGNYSLRLWKIALAATAICFWLKVASYIRPTSFHA